MYNEPNRIDMYWQEKEWLNHYDIEEKDADLIRKYFKVGEYKRKDKK